MNISPQNITGTCNLKCAYSFNYNTSNSTATNYGQYIQLTYEASSTPQVTYNTAKYNVSTLTIYSPSLHLYNNAKADAEILISHTPINGGSSLVVCIPINTSGSTTDGSQIITDIFKAVSSNAPSQGTSTTQGIKEFTLNDIVPMKPYYSYTMESNSRDIIVYGIQYAISIDNKVLETLKKCIKPNSITLPSGPSLFSNPDGPSNNDVGDGSIYIDCQPTNSSEEEIEMNVNIKSPVSYDVGSYMLDILNNPIFLILCSSIIFVIILMALHKLISHFTSDNGIIPSPKLHK